MKKRTPQNAHIKKQTKPNCPTGRLCDAQYFFDQVEQCKICKKTS